jgi:hypothetical protein
MSTRCLRVVLLVLTLGVAPLFAQQQNTATASLKQTAVTVDIVQDASAPLQIVNQTGTTQDQLQSVTVQNTTDKEVIGFEIGWVAAVPAGCTTAPGNNSVIVEQNSASRDMRIPPKGIATANEYAVSAKKLLAMAKARQAVLVNTQVAVISVSFADGSSWKKELQAGVFSSSQLSAEGKNLCKNGSLTRPAACKTKLASATLAGPVLATTTTGAHYVCADTFQTENCSNSVPDLQSCTNNICKDPSSCALQHCELVFDDPK